MNKYFAITQQNTAQEQACQDAVRVYLDATGMHPTEFARRIGYAKSTVSLFLSGRYASVGTNTAKVVAAAERFMAVHPVAPSRPLHGELFETANVRLIDETFCKLLLRPRAFLIYAPPGSQKSFVLEHKIYELNRREMSKNADGARAYYIYCREGITPYAILGRIATACGLSPYGSCEQIIDRLREEHRRRRCLLVLDEAQHLSIECFETVRELLDCEPYFSLLFSGSHDLHLKFETASATLEQWNSRIAQKVRLPGCTQAEALAIVEREVGHIISRNSAEQAQSLAAHFVSQATVEDVYTPVPAGKPRVRYINIRTLCNSLDDFKTQYAAKQPAAPAQKEDAA